MSEKLSSHNHEKQPAVESKESLRQREKIGEKLSAEAEKAGEKDQKKHEHEARKSAEKLALSSKEIEGKPAEKKRQKDHAPKGVRKQTYQSTMRRVESKLPAYQRGFSKVLRNPTVDKVSNVTAKTVARPSALLGASLFAAIGMIIATYYANQIGFEISPALFVVLIGLGWAAGLLIEGLSKAIKRI